MDDRPERRPTFIDRTATLISPAWGLQRARARLALDILNATDYDGASVSRRTQGWRVTHGDANAAVGPSAARLRASSRDLVRNNPNAEAALGIISDDVVGTGIVPSSTHELFKEWATDKDQIDADGMFDFAGLQALMMRGIVESGEMLVRRRFRRPEDGLAIPIQLQILEPDFLDTNKDGPVRGGSGRVVHGVEFNGIGKRVAYHLFDNHPGSMRLTAGSRMGQSRRIPATEILHVYDVKRAGQVRGASWFAPVLLRFKDFDEYEDATLMKNKVAACLAVITSDIDGTAPPLGAADENDESIDLLEPGMILNIPPGRSMQVVSPPQIREYSDYASSSLRQIAAGLGVTYEDLTGDYEGMPFSAARMSRLRHWARVQRWRTRMLQPQFLNPVWIWAMDAVRIMGGEVIETTEWTAPPLPMIEPDKEGLAIQRNIRNGISTWSEEIRRRGYRVPDFLDEYQGDLEELDRRGIVLDSDARQMTQAGQLQGTAQAEAAAAAEPAEPEPEPEPPAEPEEDPDE